MEAAEYLAGEADVPAPRPGPRPHRPQEHGLLTLSDLLEDRTEEYVAALNQEAQAIEDYETLAFHERSKLRQENEQRAKDGVKELTGAEIDRQVEHFSTAKRVILAKAELVSKGKKALADRTADRLNATQSYYRLIERQT